MNRFATLSTGASLCALLLTACGRPAATASSVPPSENVILIGWDGAQQAHLEALLTAGRLPHLKKLIDGGRYVRTRVTSGRTQTKPGWAEILSGYSAKYLMIESNRVYRPIPPGWTVFERVKARFGNRVRTAFIGGKINNIGHRGPHEICANAVARRPTTKKKTYYWDRKEFPSHSAGTYDGLPPRWVRREGEPFFNAKGAIDVLSIGLGPAANVGKKALEFLDAHDGRRIFAFLHFEEPDEQAHIFGEDSEEYSYALETTDAWLGRIIAKLKAEGIYGKTALFVATDHGMDEGGTEHRNAPDTFLALNLPRRMRYGDRKDVAPTLLRAFGLDPKKFRPRMQGRSLLTD